ncbi:MAG: redoxin domain-containing protein [Flavobacteriaceae bacterium]|nr:MAG: redoxin domain-containing protein [Flavobacteriaceae bacterium]
MKNILLTLTILLPFQWGQSQTLKGQLKYHAGQQIMLTGFNYYKTFELTKTIADSLGNFTLTYPKGYRGMAVLKTQNNSSLIVVLTEPDITIKGTDLKEVDSLHYINGVRNQQYANTAKAYIQQQQVYKAWRYLQPKYKNEEFLKPHKEVSELINKEIKRIEAADDNIIKTLPKNSYLRWFVPMRKLVNDMPATAYSYTERLTKNIEQFRNIDFNHPNFKTSGLFKELIEGHYLLLENMGQSLDSIYTQMNISTDYIIHNLKADNGSLLNTISEKLYKYFEKRSLFKAAAHLSNQMLEKNPHVLKDSIAKTMQKYRNLKAGNIAPDIRLNATKKLSDYKQPVLLVFGASWCPSCKDGIKELLKYYEPWKTKKNVEVVYISIDTDKEEYEKAYQNVPWHMYCNYKGRDTQAAKDYFVNATPTYLLLDKDRKILVHPNSLGHADAWVNYKL